MAPNLNIHHTCYWCIQILKWIPVIFIVTIIMWSYYAYVLQLCLFTVPSTIEKVLYLVVYHVLFAMFSWAYWQTIFTEIGRVPKRFKLSVMDFEKLDKEENEENQRRILDRVSRDLPVLCQTATRGARYCEKCRHIKPDRAHHCSACGTCVLKMDHHCPWVNNCVAFTNYKFFILFLGYSLLYCLFVASTTVQYFIKFWRNELTEPGRFHILFLFFMAVMFAISLASLFCYHCYLVSVNRTTLESFRAPIFQTGPDKDGFHLGRYNNFVAVFGENSKHWFLPLLPPMSLEDGVVYPTRTSQGNSYNSMGSTQTSCTVGDGVSFPQSTIADDQDDLLSDRQRWAQDGELEGVQIPEGSGRSYVSEAVISHRNNGPV